MARKSSWTSNLQCKVQQSRTKASGSSRPRWGIHRCLCAMATWHQVRVVHEHFHFSRAPCPLCVGVAQASATRESHEAKRWRCSWKPGWHEQMGRAEGTWLGHQQRLLQSAPGTTHMDSQPMRTFHCSVTDSSHFQLVIALEKQNNTKSPNMPFNTKVWVW